MKTVSSDEYKVIQKLMIQLIIYIWLCCIADNPGSIIRGNPGVLSYAENTNYHDNARLEWFIYVPGSKRISLRLEKSGLERCCDKVNIYKTTQSLSYDLVGSMA